MAINYDQRQVSAPDLTYIDGDGNVSMNPDAYKYRKPGEAYDYLGADAAGQGVAVSTNYRDQFTNRELYDEQLGRQSGYDPYFGTIGPAVAAYNHYDPYTDYRVNPIDFRTNVPGFNALVDQLNSASDDEFNNLVFSSLLSFATAGIGGALGAGTAAAGEGASAAASGGGFFAGEGGLLGNLGSSFANSAVNGAIKGGLTSAISGGNPITGALTSGITGGLGSQFSGFDFGLGDAGNKALASALTGAVSSGVSGGNPLIGAAASGAGSALGSVFNGNFSFGGADGGSNGFQLPDGYSQSDLNYFDNFQFPQSSGSGGNVSDFNFSDLFNNNSNSSGLLDYFSGQNSSVDPNGPGIGGLFDSLGSGNNSNFDFSGLQNLFGGDGSTGLTQQDLLDEQNSGFTPEEISQIENFKSTGGTDYSKLGQNILSKIAGLFGGGGGGGGGGLARLLSGNGGNFGQTLGNLTSGILTNSQKKAIEGARDTSVNLADPFRQQRGQYQTKLSSLLANPGSISSSPVFQGIFDLGLEGVNRSASAKGQLNSGNRLAALSDYGQKTASQYYFPQATLLSNLAGANAGSPAGAAQLNLSGTETAQNLRAKQGADFVGGLTGYSPQNNGLSSFLQGLNALNTKGN